MYKCEVQVLWLCGVTQCMQEQGSHPNLADLTRMFTASSKSKTMLCLWPRVLFIKSVVVDESANPEWNVISTLTFWSLTAWRSWYLRAETSHSFVLLRAMTYIQCIMTAIFMFLSLLTNMSFSFLPWFSSDYDRRHPLHSLLKFVINSRT